MPKTLLAALAVLMLAAAPAAASPLDPSFGSGGVARIDDPENTAQFDFAMLVQPDGKIVVAGSTRAPSPGHDSFALARFNANGTPDTTFGTNGFVQTTMGNNKNEIIGLALQPDGKIVAAGYDESVDDTAVARYNPDGSLDTTADADPTTHFSTDGKLVIDAPALGREDFADAVVVQSSGKIVVGLSFDVNGSDFDVGLLRLEEDGDRDTTFGTNGFRGLNISNANDRYDILWTMLQEPNGKIVVAGESNMSGGAGSDYAFSFARFNVDGTLDDGTGADSTPSDDFGSAGTQTVQLTNSGDVVQGLARQPDGKLIAVGSSNVTGSGSDFAVVRLSTLGELDDSGPGAFSVDGKLTTPIAPGVGTDSAQAVALQPDGKIVVAGSASDPTPGSTFPDGWALVRYTATGALDASFDFDGITLAPATGRAVGVTAVDGKLVAAGTTFVPGTSSEFTAARYHQNDVDSDGAADGADNCATTTNPGQEDVDGDGIGDACDPTDDRPVTVPPADAGTSTTPAPSSPAQTPPLPPPPLLPAGATNGDDLLNGTAAADRICGLLGDDTVNGLGGDDTLFGDACDDVLRLQAAVDGDDRLFGGSGNDKLFGAGGDDALSGGRGNDRLNGGRGRNSYSGGAGRDTISAANSRRETVNCGSGRDRATVDRNDRVRGCERVTRRR